MLDEGKISAYFGDRSILLFLIEDSKAPQKLRLADDYLTVEPYALALPRGDEDFRLAVIKDCCADLDPSLHDCLINKFFPSRAAVLSAREFVEAS